MNNANRSYKTRTILLFLFFCSLYSIIGVTLFMIQIMQKDFFANLGKQQYNVTITMQPERAPIVDRTGKQFLAMNKDSFAAFILPKQIKKEKELLSFLQMHFPQSVARLEQNKHKNFMFIKRKLSDKKIKLIKESNIEDVYLLKEPSRFYPVEAASPVIGLTNIDNIGLSGIELLCDKTLSGSPTTFYLEKDARLGHFHFKKETKVQGNSAEPVMLTLSSDLQFLAAQELEESVAQYNAKEGAVIVIDPTNGDIHTMVSYPYFDPNDTKTCTPINSKNKPITDCYELGSVIKVFAALAALEEGAAKLDELIDCKNKKTAFVDGRQINTVTAHGVITFSEVVEKSNNIGIAIVAKRVGEKIYDHYTNIGFGTKTGIPFPAEQSGFVNPPSNWSKQSIISLSYGYEISATLLQLAQAFCMIANNGIPTTPKLLLEKADREKENKEKANGEKKQIAPNRKPLYSQASIDAIKNILENTTLRGTTRRARIKGYKVMCKTGTANLLVNGAYSPDDNIFTCAGIIEKDAYKRVIVVFLKEIETKGIYAQTVAVPLFEKIAEKTLIHDKIL